MSNLQGLNFYGDSTISDILRDNVISFVKYGLLEIGAYINIEKGQLNYLGNNMSRLYPIQVSGIANNRIYRDVKTDWVWEPITELKFTSGTPPIQPSGIYVDNIFYPTGTTVNGATYSLDYSRGQVVFSSGLPSGTLVELDRTIRGVHVYDSDNTELRTFVSNWNKFDNSHNPTDIAYRAYVPCISIEVGNHKTIKGTELGSRSMFVRSEVEFNVYSVDGYTAKKLADLLFNLQEKRLPIFYTEKVPKPLNHRGELINPTGVMWPDLISRYAVGEARFAPNFASTKIKSSNADLYHIRCRIGLEFDCYPL